MPKTKQQEAQEKRLQRNIRQAKKTRADAKTSGNKTVRTRPPKKGGFFAGLKTDAPQTVQQSIPYKEMYRDGICRLTDKLYTKTVQFFDINYQLAQADDKAQIFEGYCDFLNYFDASIHVQLTFINQRANMQDFARSIDIPIRGDEYDGIRREYGDMLKSQLQKGNNGLTKRKYITFGIEADDLRTAKMRLERIEADVLANFKALGAQAKPLDGLDRLELLHSQLHPDGQEKFHFTWADLPKTGLSTKDYIAPSGLSFSNDGKTFRVADHSGAVSFLQILAPELTDRLLAELLDLDDAVTVNLHIQSIDQTQAIKNIKRKMSDLQKMTIEEQKKAVRAGYDMDIIPTDLATYGEEAKNLLQDLQSRNERMFLVTVLVENIASKRQKLFNDILSASGIAQKYNCALKRLDYQQEQGLMSSLALGLNQIEIERGLTTSSTAIFVPFTTCELFQDPYVLMGYLTSAYQDFTYAQIESVLRELFNGQYSLSFTEETEIRYRTETSIDPETGEETEEEVPYEWHILNVTLTSMPLENLVVSRMDADQKEICEILLQTKGNRQYVKNVFGTNWLPYVTSYYGYRVHPISGKKNYHTGVDIGMPQGTEILAGHDGTVTLAGNAGGYGLCVAIEGEAYEGHSLTTKYGHCSQILVSAGQEVKAGDVIAKVGSTGNSTGPHPCRCNLWHL